MLLLFFAVYKALCTKSENAFVKYLILFFKNYAIAEELLELLDEEIKKYSSTNALYKLSQLITWEILLVNVVEWETKYPAKHISMCIKIYQLCII